MIHKEDFLAVISPSVGSFHDDFSANHLADYTLKFGVMPHVGGGKLYSLNGHYPSVPPEEFFGLLATGADMRPPAPGEVARVKALLSVTDPYATNPDYDGWRSFGQYQVGFYDTAWQIGAKMTFDDAVGFGGDWQMYVEAFGGLVTLDSRQDFTHNVAHGVGLEGDTWLTLDIAETQVVGAVWRAGEPSDEGGAYAGAFATGTIEIPEGYEWFTTLAEGGLLHPWIAGDSASDGTMDDWSATVGGGEPVALDWDYPDPTINAAVGGRAVTRMSPR